MTKDQLERLKPFFHGKGARQRVVFFLIASGYSASQLLALTSAELRALKMPADIQVSRDEMLYGHKPGLAFLYPSGNPMRVTDCKRLVKDASLKVLNKPMSLELFRAYIVSSSSKRSV